MCISKVCFCVSGVGDFSVWEFAGNPVYYCSYDYFAANDPTAVHVVVFSLEEPYETQLNQVTFWLNFLKSLIPPEELTGLSEFKITATLFCCFVFISTPSSLTLKPKLCQNVL